MAEPLHQILEHGSARLSVRAAAAALSAGLGAVDRLQLAFLAVLALVAFAVNPASLPGISLAALALVGIAGCSRLGGHVTAVVHDLSPIVGVVLLFELCGPLVGAIHAERYDAALSAIDASWFTWLDARWHGALGRPWWLTDLASVAYVGFYVIPTVIAIELHARGRREEFDAFAFALAATLLASYALYFVLPASGPRVPVEREAELIGGSMVSATIRHFIHLTEGVYLDAFPSGHTAGSLVFGLYGCRAFPRWTAALAPAVGLIIFSTVYLSFHYVIDVAAGAVLATAMTLLVPTLRRWFTPALGARQAQA